MEQELSIRRYRAAELKLEVRARRPDIAGTRVICHGCVVGTDNLYCYIQGELESQASVEIITSWMYKIGLRDFITGCMATTKAIITQIPGEYTTSTIVVSGTHTAQNEQVRFQIEAKEFYHRARYSFTDGKRALVIEWADISGTPIHLLMDWLRADGWRKIAVDWLQVLKAFEP